MSRAARILSFVVSLVPLHLSAAITGSVINNDGQPIAGARVSAYAPETLDARRARLLSKTPERTPLLSVTTDVKGGYSLDVKEPFADVRFEATGYAPTAVRAASDEDLGPTALAQAATQTGTISANGKPLPGALVVWSSGGEVIATTDANGRYSVPDPAKWAAHLTVYHPDYAMIDELTGGFAGLGDAKKSLDRTLTSGTRLTGRVVAEDGQTPVANAVIVLDAWPVTTSADDGTFTIAHAPKTWHQVEARIGDRHAVRASSANASTTLRLGKAATLTGSVRDMKNQPIAGVEVRLNEGGGFLRSALMTTRSAITDAKGNYAIAPVAPGTYELDASRGGFAPVNASIAVAAGQKATKSLYVTARGRIAGSVIDEARNPVAGAHVTSRPAGGRDRMMMAPIRGLNETQVTGPDGRFVLRNVYTEGDVQVEATKKGYPSARSSSMRTNAGERKAGVVLTIPTGVAISGKVVDGDGKAVSGVAVTTMEAQNEGGPGGMVRRMILAGAREREDDVVRTGSDGLFTIRLKEGSYDLTFRREGFASKSLRAQQVTAKTPPLEVKLDPGVEITGRVVRGGAGVEGVNVNAVGVDGLVSSVTGPDGSFRLGDLTPGSLMLTANKQEDFIQQMRNVTAPARDVVIELPPGGRITGRVVDKATHNPVTNFQAGIATSRSGGGMMFVTPPQMKSFTSDDGTFTLENVPAGPAELVVNAPGYTSGRVPSVNVEEGKTVADIEVSLDTGVKVTGRVTGPDGGPLGGVAVRIDTDGGRVMRFNGPPGMDGATTDPNGEYSLDAVESGEKTLQFSRQGYLSTSKTVTLSGREARVDAQLSSGLVVSGQVVSEAGAPVPDATIRVSGGTEGFMGRGATSDGSGAFTVEGVAPGHYTFSASKSGLADGVLRDVDVSTGAPVRIVMKTGGTIFGHVTGLSEKELQQATVRASSPNGGASAPVDATGSYRIEGAPTGTVRVSAQAGSGFAEGKTSPVQSVQVDAGGSVQVDLQFNSSTVVRGRVTRAGQPLASAMVAFFPRGGASTNARTSTDSNGAYQVSGLEDATYDVQVMDMQRTTPYTATYEVRGSGTFDIDMKVSSLRGRVVDAGTGEPIRDAMVSVARSDLNAGSFLSSRSAQTDSGGGFVIDSVTPGSYHVSADKEGYGHDIHDVVVSDTSTEEVTLKLAKSDGIRLKVVDARDGTSLRAFVRVSDAQGRIVYESPFRLEAGSDEMLLTVAPGSYRAVISADGYASQNVFLNSPGRQTVGLTPGGTLVLRSTSSQRRRVRLVDANGNEYQRGIMRTNSFPLDPSPLATTLTNIAPGVYTLQILDANEHVVNTIPNVQVLEGVATQHDV